MADEIYLGGPPLSYNYLRNRWPWGDTVTVIASDGLAIGSVSFEGDEFGYISNLCVAPQVRKRGRASTILALLEIEILKRGLRKARLGAVEGEWPYRWYLRKGYADTGVIDIDLGYKIMEKILENGTDKG